MNRYSYGDRLYYNLWSMENVDRDTTPNDDEVVKTVYDPCPAGFHLPPSNAFTGFTTTGATIYGESDPPSSMSRVHSITGGTFTAILTEAAI